MDAFKKVKTDKKLVIAGGTSDTDEYAEGLLKSAENDERIIFTGFQQGVVLQQLYSNAYVYVLPSLLEGMPLSLLEAMSYKNCCVVSDIDECVEVVEDKAVVVKAGDVQSLAQKLQLLCDDHDLFNKFKDNAQDFILKKHNWDNVTTKTLELYKKLI